MRRHLIGLLFAAAHCALAFPASGLEVEPSPEHGKINTADATPVGTRVVEVEASYAPSWSEGWGHLDDAPAAHHHTLGLSVTWGIADDADLHADAGYAFVHEESEGERPEDGHGYRDMSVGGRYRFLSKDGLDVAAVTSVVLPTGADESPARLGIIQVYYSWDGALVASADAGRATGNLELGFSLPIGSAREQDRGVMTANVATGYQVLPWLQPEMELGFEHAFARGPDADLLTATAGVVAPWGDGNRITAGVQQAIWGRGTPAFTAASIACKAAF